MKITNMRKFLPWAVALLCLALLLTACGSSAAPSESADASSAAQASSAASAVDYTGYTDEEFLAAVQNWENEAAPGVIYVFYEDGTGQLTADHERHVYDMAWSVEDGTLTFEMTEDWPYVNDVQFYDIVTDKQEPSFLSRNPDTGSEATFVPRGTVWFPTYEDNKPEELLGLWVRMSEDPQAMSHRVWYLAAKDERSGYGGYYPDDKQVFVQYYFDDWDVVEDSTLVFVFENGTEQRFSYTLEGDTLTMSEAGGEPFAFERLDPTGVEVNL